MRERVTIIIIGIRTTISVLIIGFAGRTENILGFSFPNEYDEEAHYLFKGSFPGFDIFISKLKLVKMEFFHVLQQSKTFGAYSTQFTKHWKVFK